jgi:ribose/xylose/arabinose/galactoside ABC-type transport system permease subunit
LFILGVFVALLVSRGQLANFFRLSNLQLLLYNASIPAVVALGMLIVVVSGGIDLSVGSVVALVTVTAMQLYNHVLERSASPATASLAAVAGGVGVGALCGLTNGLLVTRLKVMPFVATLGMLSLVRGLAYWRSKDPRITFASGETPAWVQALQPGSTLLLFNAAVWSVVVLAVLVALFLHVTVLGRHCYAIGSNEAASRFCGVPVERRRLVFYLLAGLLTGWGGILMFAKTESGDTTCAQGLELEVIAAVVIGGASLAGGRGTVTGTLLGVFLLTALESLLSFTQMPLELKNILLGAVVIINTALGRLQRRAA